MPSALYATGARVLQQIVHHLKPVTSCGGGFEIIAKISRDIRSETSCYPASSAPVANLIHQYSLACMTPEEMGRFEKLLNYRRCTTSLLVQLARHLYINGVLDMPPSTYLNNTSTKSSYHNLVMYPGVSMF